MSLFPILPNDIFSIYTEFIAKLLRRIHIKTDGVNFVISLGEEQEATIDERIQKIDKARENLVEGLAAIDELRKSAEENKKELQNAVSQLAQLEDDKQKLEAKLESMREIAHADVRTFRELAGIPSPAAIKRERFVGFLSGILASLAASGLIYVGVQVIKHWPKIVGWF
jgi:hypothetical protein